MKLFKTALLLITFTISSHTFAACKWVWVDHDYNMATPAVQKQLCDSSIDTPAIKTPSIQPIQSPKIKPIETPSIPPIGTKSCRTQNVYDYATGKWVDKKICN